jgi:hypothetical protein
LPQTSLATRHSSAITAKQRRYTGPANPPGYRVISAATNISPAHTDLQTYSVGSARTCEYTSGSWESGKNGTAPGILIEGNPQPGDQHMQEYAPKSEAEDFAQVLDTGEGSCVEDPAGQVAEHKYYAQGVGNIKTQTLDASEVEQLVAVQ